MTTMNDDQLDAMLVRFLDAQAETIGARAMGELTTADIIRRRVGRVPTGASVAAHGRGAAPGRCSRARSYRSVPPLSEIQRGRAPAFGPPERRARYRDLPAVAAGDLGGLDGKWMDRRKVATRSRSCTRTARSSTGSIPTDGSMARSRSDA